MSARRRGSLRIEVGEIEVSMNGRTRTVHAAGFFVCPDCGERVHYSPTVAAPKACGSSSPGRAHLQARELAGAALEERQCANADCGLWFVPETEEQKVCSRRCSGSLGAKARNYKHGRGGRK